MFVLVYHLSSSKFCVDIIICGLHLAVLLVCCHFLAPANALNCNASRNQLANTPPPPSPSPLHHLVLPAWWAVLASGAYYQLNNWNYGKCDKWLAHTSISIWKKLSERARQRERKRERGMQQLIEVTSNTWPSTAPTVPALACPALPQQRLISHQLIINERRCA